MNAVGRIAPVGVRRVPVRRALLPAQNGSATEPAPAIASGSSEIRAPEIAGLRPDSAVGVLLDHSVRLSASDLFFSFNDNHVAVSVRHLGIVRLLAILTTEHARRCTSYIKAMAGMDLAEQRRPLDGRWVRDVDNTFVVGRDADEFDEEDHPTTSTITSPHTARIDLRVSTIPTVHGEDMAIRLLVSTPQLVSLDQLGMSRRELNELAAMLDIPSGLILVSGPTGSGKTTTLYACLRHLNNGQRKIHTIEDPIEYAVPGLRQSQINPKADVGFPELLRSVLRQSPDVILIGEIRDAITTEIAIRAASSGHLVLASVHAPSAPGAVQSLLGLGANPHFLSSSLQGVIAQRLVRTLCAGCKVVFELDDSPRTFDEIRKWIEPDEGHALHGARGCVDCLQTGYSGRTGVFEVLRITRELRPVIAQSRPTGELREKALQGGLLDLRRAALLKLARGQTSAEEILRAIPPEDLGLDD
jgi:type II secretory ATPase GspE/PulE/Tfp pilus assembly ATPase PilB-like protein